MADHDLEQKTEQLTEKKISEAFDRRQFAESHELTVLFLIAAVLGVLALTAQSALHTVAEYSIGMFPRFATTEVGLASISGQLGEAMLIVARVLVLLLVGMVVAVLLSSGVQSGFRLTAKAVAIKFENLHPVTGFERVFSKAVLVRSAIGLLELVAIGGALWPGARGMMRDPLFSSPVEAAYLGQFPNP